MKINHVKQIYVLKVFEPHISVVYMAHWNTWS